MLPASPQVGFRTSTSFSRSDDVTWVRGPHTLHLGIDSHMDEAYNNLANNASGSFSFSSNTTASYNPSGTPVIGTGDPYASFLLGTVSSITDSTNGGVTYRTWRYAGYVQDDCRARPRLSVNLGVRYDFQKQPVELKDRNGNLDINQTNPATGLRGSYVYVGTAGLSSNFVKENYNDYGIRIGFAWGVDHMSRTILRGGIGMHYPNVATLTYDLSAGNATGFANLNTRYQSVQYNGFVGFLKDGLPYAPPLPWGAAGGPNAFIGQGVSYSQPDAKTSRPDIATLTVSRQLFKSLTLDVSYLQNIGHHFPVAPYSLDSLNPSYFSLDSAYLFSYVPNPYVGMVPGFLGNPSIGVQTVLRPFPYMANVSTSYPRIGAYEGRFGYFSLQRRYSRGTYFQVSYTYGKLLKDPLYTSLGTTGGVTGLGAGSGPGAYHNHYNLRGDHSVDANDVTHRAAASVIYLLPLGAGQRFGGSSKLVRLYLSGFHLSTTMSAQAGRPLGLSLSNAPAGNGADRPNVVPGVSLYNTHRTALSWFNAAAFVAPPAYTYGNVARNSSVLRGPGGISFNSSLSKETKIRGRLHLQVRVKTFNVLNHTNFSNPGTTFVVGPNGVNTSSAFGQITYA